MLFGNGFAGGFNPVREYVSQGGDGDAVRGFQEVVHGSVAASATTDETGLEGTAVNGLVRQFGDVIGAGLAERFLFVAARAGG